MHLLISKLKVLFWHLKSIVIKTEVKIPTLLYSTLLVSILGQSTTSARPMQIYMDVGVSLLCFKYPTTIKKTLLEISFLYLLPCKEFLLFLRCFASSFWWFFFSFLRRILYNTWKSYYKQLELLYKLKKALVNVSSIAHSKNNSFWVLHQELLLMNVSKTVCRSALVLLWLRTIGEAMKTLRFHSNTHSLDQSIISSQCVIQRHIQNPSKHLRWSGKIVSDFNL